MVSREEILRNLIDHNRPEGSKVLEREHVVAEVRRRRRAGQRIVFTNGCFDLLHPGHVGLLREAAALGDFLVVGLNSDASVRGLKGPDRPLNSAAARAEVLSALEAVDAVTVFEEDTPLELIRAICPDVLVKGRDYPPDEVVGRVDVENAGGKLVLVPLVEGHSTTGLVRRAGERTLTTPTAEPPAAGTDEG
jgi:rfaE bifunctional protein nucleotidyltransferase chain/domain